MIAAMVSEFLATDKEITSETLSDLENDISTALKLLIGNRASAEAKSAAETGLEQVSRCVFFFSPDVYIHTSLL